MAARAAGLGLTREWEENRAALQALKPEADALTQEGEKLRQAGEATDAARKSAQKQSSALSFLTTIALPVTAVFATRGKNWSMLKRTGIVVGIAAVAGALGGYIGMKGFGAEPRKQEGALKAADAQFKQNQQALAGKTQGLQENFTHLMAERIVETATAPSETPTAGFAERHAAPAGSKVDALASSRQVAATAGRNV